MSADGKADTGFNRSSNQTVTKGEMDTLVGVRPKPVIEHHLTPGGDLETSVRQTLNVQKETRITQIQNRLTNASNRLNRDHSKAMVKGTAKADFDRSR